jgi:GTP-binding protein Era
MLIKNQNPKNRTITIPVLGLTNSGKSTFINNITGNHLNLISKHPQATRNSIHSVYHKDFYELVFVDMPGFFETISLELNLRMKGEIDKNLKENFFLLLIDSSRYELKYLIPFLKDLHLKKTWIIFTKKDLNENFLAENAFQELKTTFPNLHLEKFFFNFTYEELRKELFSLTESRHHVYPHGDLSDKNIRFFAAEFIREAAIENLRDEVPFETTVLIEDFKEALDGKIAHIHASIVVNRPGQKTILIGKNGDLIKNIGIKARKKIEELVGGQVFLGLHVKVTPKWFKNNRLLEELGLFRTKESVRVWRK